MATTSTSPEWWERLMTRTNPSRITSLADGKNGTWCFPAPSSLSSSFAADPWERPDTGKAITKQSSPNSNTFCFAMPRHLRTEPFPVGENKASP